MEYNSERTHLIIPEYGRHVQKLVGYCVHIEDKEERNKMARALIDVMGNLQPFLRDVPDFKHKLWDQLFIMSEFKLDADSPYEKPSQEKIEEKPEPLPYPKAVSKYRFYGENIQIMIDKAISWEESDLKDALIFTIANHMKKCYLNWNKDTVDDEIILRHLRELSDGKIDIKLEDIHLSESKDLLRKRSASSKYSNKHSQKKNTNHKTSYKSNTNKKYKKRS